MNVLHVNHFGSNAGGVEGYIAEVSSALSAAGHASHLVYFAGDEASALIEHRTRVEYSDDAEPLKSATPQLERIMAEFHPDVAFVHALYDPALMGWIFRRLPTIAYVHGPYVGCPGNALYLKRSSRVCMRKGGPVCLLNAQLERCCFGRSPVTHLRQLVKMMALIRKYRDAKTHLLVGSRFMQQHLNRNGIPLDRIGILPPVLIGADLSKFERSLEPRTILYAGRLTSEKGLAQLMEALAPIHDKWKLLVAGDGPQRSACEQLAGRLDISERVDFLGWVLRSDMHALYRRCGFIVFPSLWPEPFGRIGPESFSHGRPVIAFAVGGIPDWLDDGRVGYLVAPGNVGQMSDCILRLLNSPEAQEEMGRTALAKARTAWNGEEHVDALIAHMESARKKFGS